MSEVRTSSVKIGPSFFANELKEYNDWRWAFVREAMQNSVDAKGVDKIEVSVSLDGEDTVFAWSNNGEAMSEDVVVNKLFCLGESGKRFDGAVGGFGKAKILLYFTHNHYLIETGNLVIDGSGADYEITKIDQYTHEHFAGTKSTVRIKGDHVTSLESAVRKFARYAQWNGTLLLDGVVLDCNHQKGSRRRDLGFGVVYTNKSDQNKLVIRIGGIPMFVQYCGHDRLVILELSGKSSDSLTSNRDGLSSGFRDQLSSFITELSVDTKSALADKAPQYEHFAGRKLAHRVMGLDELSYQTADEPQTEPQTDETLLTLVGATGEFRIAETQPNAHARSGEHVRCAAYSRSDEEVKPQIRLDNEFVIKNESGLVVPNYYRPGMDEFSDYSRKLIKIWGRLLVQLHRSFNHQAEFGLGFIFDEDTVAQHENRNFGRIYYISPAKIVEQSSTSSKSFKKRWLFNNAGKKMLLSVAAHEFTHGLGYDWHSETFAAKYTEIVGELFHVQKQFNWCFK